MMSALVLGVAERDRINALRERAAAAPFSMAEMERRSRGFDPANPKTRTTDSLPPEFTIEIPRGFTVTYTIEEQPIGLCRHISVSVDTPGRLPNSHALAWLLEAFGFMCVKGGEPNQQEPRMRAAIQSGALYTYPEDCGTRWAINAFEVIA